LRACGDRFRRSNHHRKGRRAWDGSLMTASTRGGPPVWLRMSGHLPLPAAKERLPMRHPPATSGMSTYPSRTRCRTEKIIGWRGACTCGWMGSLWERDANPADADSEGGRDRICLDAVANASRKIEDAIHDEWRAHLPLRRYPVASAALAAVEAAAREYEQASERLNSAVADARAAGASWAKVGEAAGCSRQSVYKRWAESNSAGPADDNPDRFRTPSQGQPPPLHLVGTKRLP
jgi:hypothetical protein